MREREVEDYLVMQVQAMGGLARKLKWDGCRGAPDRYVMLPGHGIWVELKSPGGRVAPHQSREHTRMRNLGQDVRVIDSFEAIDHLLANPQPQMAACAKALLKNFGDYV